MNSLSTRDRAIALAEELVGQPVRVKPRSGSYNRYFAIGDPQASRQRFFSVLAAHDLLGPDGLLRSDVSLLSIGDHFDYPGVPALEAGFEGLAILRWLAEHPADQVPILVGNHDLARVIELSDFTDRAFADAQALALQISTESDEGKREPMLAEFAHRYPRVPTPTIVARDFSAFLETQRTLLVELLLAGRVRLAAEARLSGGRAALATHAGVTKRELAILGLPLQSGVSEIVSSLNQRLDEAVERVRRDWELGAICGRALDLAPLHVAGTAGAEGGGLLYHRPADPERSGADASWEGNPERPRRFDPRAIPPKLAQIVGHTTHRKARRELARWVRPESDVDAFGMLRTLTSRDGAVTYELGRAQSVDAAQIFMIDGHLIEAEPADYQLLQVERWH